jgi:hypothetical protein
MSERLVIRTTGQTGPAGGGGGGGSAASDITFSPTGTIAATNVQAAIAEVATDAATAYQPLDSDLTAIAALTTTTFGRALLALADAAALRTSAGLVIGTDVAAQSSLASYLTTAAAASGYQPLDSDLTSIAALTTTAYGRAFLALANQAALMALLSAASDTTSGIVELATTAETTTGTDATRAVTPSGLANATTASNINARTVVKKAGTTIGTRRAINFIEGTNVTITTTDDAGNEEVDVTIAASGGGGLGAADKLVLAGVGRFASARYYGPGETGGSFSTAFSTATNWMTFIPWVCPADMTVDRIGIFSNSVTGNIRLGIYTATSAGAPSTLVVDSGAIVVSGSGVREATISQALTGGVLYYLACLADANLNIAGLATNQMGLVMGSATLAAAYGVTLAGSQTYGALPTSPPTIAYDPSTAGPCIQVRAV